MADIPKDWKPVRSRKTYQLREELKELGARWDRDTQMWWVSPEKEREANDLAETHDHW